MYPPVDPIIVQLGPLTLRWYGLLIMIGIMLATWTASRYVARRGQDPNTVWDMLMVALIPVLIGARLYYVFIQSGPEARAMYLANPLEILQIWHGGLHIFGGFILGIVVLVLFARWKNLPLPIYLDAVGLGLPLGQAIGRLGNFINQELYGPPTTLPWGLRIDAAHRLPIYDHLSESVRFHPLFLYEMLWNLIGFALIFWVSRRFERSLRDGDLFLLYLIWYPFGRFWIEFLRVDSWFFAGTPFNIVHILTFLSVVGASALLYLRHRRLTSTQPSQPSQPSHARDE
jgi:phosphatidylglycerol:prolipoprotein diacylglycerol transferase